MESKASYFFRGLAGTFTVQEIAGLIDRLLVGTITGFINPYFPGGTIPRIPPISL